MDFRPSLTFGLARFIATGFYSGYLRPAPGTAGSLSLVALWLLAKGVFYPQSLAGELLAIIVLAAIGLWSAGVVQRGLGAVQLAGQKKPHDPSFIVIDEWLGMLIGLAGIGVDEHFKIFCAFVLFRFFDILKPGPVRWAEKAPGVWGIMLDDAVGGVLTCVVITCVFTAFGV